MKKFAFTLMELMLIFFILAILAILFYRTLKPDKIVFNKLYSSAYSQMEEAYKEVLAYSETNAGGDEYNVFSNNNFLNNYPDIFFKIVNYIGDENGSDLTIRDKRYDLDNACYQIVDDWADITFPARLSNNMQIRFDVLRLQNHPENVQGQPTKQVLVATVDINGDALPNLINKDIIQFEINERGIFPVGDIETNSNLLKFAIVSKYKNYDNENYRPIMGDETVIETNLSYDIAACKTNLPRHAFYSGTNRQCGTINVISPNCQYEALPCHIKVLKY